VIRAVRGRLPMTIGPATVRHRLAIAVSLPLIAGYVALVMAGVSDRRYLTWGAMWIAPLLLAGVLPMLRRQAVREGAPNLFWILTGAYLLKLGGALVRYVVAYGVYGGGADAQGYHEAGIRLAGQFQDLVFVPLEGSSPPTGTNFIEVINGALYTVTGPTLLGSFLVFSTLSFLGMFLFYRAFVEAAPEGRSRSYARLLFFLPSMLFWPSGTGKEAWMIFALGIVAFGAARLLTGNRIGIAYTLGGLWLAAQPRPHVAAISGVALAAAFLIRPPSRDLRQLAPLFKVVSIASVVLLALFLTIRMQAFLAQENAIDTQAGIVETVGTVNERTSQGGSEFSAPNVLGNPAMAPIAIVTVLYRPFPVEADSIVQLVAALEGIFLLGLTVVRRRSVWAAIRSMRSSPYVAFAFTYSALFIVAFSSIANFGILTRQRVQLYPFILVLLAWPVVRKSSKKPAESPASELVGGSA
jgi:hypothetical protein